MLSIIIPSRSPQYLKRTVEDLLSKAEEEVEIIVVLDGIWPDWEEMPPEDKRVTILHHGMVHESVGMREGINAGVALSRGKYIMKIDEHCMVDQGYDVKLKKDCREDWIVIPRRYRLDAEAWTIIEDGRPPIDYMCIDYPYQRPKDKTCGLHGAEWKRRDRTKYEIDDTPSFQGSCYFMHRSHWDKVIVKMESDKYGLFTQEAQELGMKTWLSGGRVVVNKRTWYAHFHKGKKGKGYGFSNEQYIEHMKGTERGRLYCIDFWLNTKDYKHDWEWFVDVKFPNMPGWNKEWKDDIIRDREKEK